MAEKEKFVFSLAFSIFWLLIFILWMKCPIIDTKIVSKFTEKLQFLEYEKM